MNKPAFVALRVWQRSCLDTDGCKLVVPGVAYEERLAVEAIVAWMELRGVTVHPFVSDDGYDGWA